MAVERTSSSSGKGGGSKKGGGSSGTPSGSREGRDEVVIVDAPPKKGSSSKSDEGSDVVIKDVPSRSSQRKGKKQLDIGEAIGIPPSDKPQGNPQVTTMFLMLGMLILLSDPNMRSGLGGVMDPILRPTVGLNGGPVFVTLFLCSIIMVGVNSSLRTFFDDPIMRFKFQKVQQQFSKEFREANMNLDKHRIKRLQQLQPQVMQLSMKVNSKQMKSMPFTMIPAIMIFMWLSSYISSGVVTHHITIPWSATWDLLDNSDTLLPHWIIIYSVVSLPINQALQKVAKYYRMQKFLTRLRAEKGVPKGA